ncbi:ligand-gated sodium channel [Desmophyllum pertusum]|uniref:Ligand-gated sodium channel n=1 Tax=Desmophyllum pertusum TaxID=174260 RepID=A0A9X0D6B9_9CNID|nr:ligand-gated sodium channel [Desmophyllum pertusum]
MDFELVQSIGQQTFENLRPFFSGVLKDDNEISASGENTKAPIGIEVMYGTFQKWGYQTLFQEDLCWYDIWGSMLTEIQRRGVPTSDSEFKSRWKEVQEKAAKKNMDHYGLTHFSCTVLVNKLGRTNHYDYPEQVCFNGEFFSWYFMDYITKVYTALKNDEKAKPLFSYMHFNTGHAMTGKRITNLDANLAKFFINMAALPNTLTVIFADHGHKMTPFSSTEEGRRELFDPSFFMIVPDGVAEKLGPQRTAALVANQKRLFMLRDVHKAFMSLNDPDKMNSQDFSETGIFSVVPANRTCADLYMLPLTRCKCEGFDEEGHIKDNAENHKWLAEFALGTLNDAIQKQYVGVILFFRSSVYQPALECGRYRRRLIILTVTVALLLLGIAVQLQLIPLVSIIQKNSEIPCPHLGQQNISHIDEASSSAIKCKPHRPDKACTEQIVRHYGQPGRVENRTCDETHYPDICSFQVTESGDNKLSCDAKMWKYFSSAYLSAILKKVEDGKKRSGININVIVLDSISRPHFYRTLPRAVEAFKKINEDPNIKATAMDLNLSRVLVNRRLKT